MFDAKKRMNTDPRLGTFEEILAPHSKDVTKIAWTLRELIEGADAESFEVPRAGEKAATYGVGSSKMKQAYCYIMPQKSYVNLGFFHGTRLPDPSRIMEGTGKLLRHVKVRSIEDVRRPELLELVKQAIQDRRQTT